MTTRNRAATSTTAEPTTLWRCGGRQCGAGECEHEENELHREASGAGPGYAPPAVHDVLRSGGAPLPDGVRRDLQSRLGHDFADVRIHTDDRAGDSARQVDALAYTVGRHVVFAPGRFSPDTGEGRRLISHELIHAATSRPGAPAPSGDLRVSSPEDREERRATRGAVEAEPRSGGAVTRS